jgi:hypothetical protein
MLEILLNQLNPDCDALLRAISRHITDDMLQEMARADYGSEAERHFAALLLLRDENRFIEPLYMVPCEVLELTRNSLRIDQPKPGGSGLRGPWMRAFACAALLRAIGPPWNYINAAGPSFDLIQLIDSVRGLPVNFNGEAAQFVAWLMSNSNLSGNDEQIIYYGIALLWFSLQLTSPPPDELLIELAEWIVLRETQLAEALPGGFDWWLLGISGAYPPPSPWQAFGQTLCELNLEGHQRPLQEWVRLIGSQLGG